MYDFYLFFFLTETLQLQFVCFFTLAENVKRFAHIRNGNAAAVGSLLPPVGYKPGLLLFSYVGDSLSAESVDSVSRC